MPLIATPISHLFESERDGEEISNVSDCLEVRQRSLDSNWSKQWLFDITHKWDDEIKGYLKKAFNKKNELKLVTFQATRCCHDEKIENGMFQLSGTIYSVEEMLNYATDNTRWLRTVLDRDVKIGLENNNYYPTPAYESVADGDFISTVVNQNDLYLLLDIAHAMVTAHNYKISYIDYITLLPLDKLVQLHICQPSIFDGSIAQDVHDKPSYNMLREVARLISCYAQIEYLTIEFYKDKDILIESIMSLRNIINQNL